MGRNARTFSRLVDSLRQEVLGGRVCLPQGGLLRVRLPEQEDSKLGGLDGECRQPNFTGGLIPIQKVSQ